MRAIYWEKFIFVKKLIIFQGVMISIRQELLSDLAAPNSSTEFEPN